MTDSEPAQGRTDFNSQNDAESSTSHSWLHVECQPNAIPAWSTKTDISTISPSTDGNQWTNGGMCVSNSSPENT